MADLFTEKTLLLDGAMGSLLQQRNFLTGTTLWAAEALINNPERVLEVHTEYLFAGADIITTNTFRTNPAAVRASGISGLSSKKLTAQAVEIARKAAAGTQVLIAGANPPAEDCYQRQRKLTGAELEFNHRNHIEWLVENKADFILNETQSHMDEIRIICGICSRMQIPFVISLYFDESGCLLSGEDLSAALKEIEYFAPSAVGFNCVKPAVFKSLFTSFNLPQKWGFYLNCGLGEHTDYAISDCMTPEKYSDEVIDFLKAKPAFIGACCGSSPKHIAALRKLLNEKNNN